MSELYCASCKRHYESDGMLMVAGWKRVKGGLKTALFLDRKNGTTHEFLSEKESEKMKPKPVEPITSLHIPEQAGGAKPPAVEEQSLVVDQATTEAEVPDAVAVNPANSDSIEDTSEVGDSKPVESDLWVPNPSSWYGATITHIGGSAGGYLFVELSNGDKVFVSAQKVNLPHQHRCDSVLHVGDPISVRMQRNSYDSMNTPWEALEAVLLKDYQVPDEESGVIVRWDNDKNFGHVMRACGCWAFVLDDTYNWNPGDAAIISNWQPNKRPKIPGEMIAQSIRPNTNPSDDVIRI